MGTWLSVRRRRLLIFIAVILLIFSGNIGVMLFREKKVRSRYASSSQLGAGKAPMNNKDNTARIQSGLYGENRQPNYSLGTNRSRKVATQGVNPNLPRRPYKNSNLKSASDSKASNATSDVLRVAFFEGFRGDSWIFDRYFKPFYSEVSCQCSKNASDVVTKQMVTKRYETKSFDIVVFPYDVTVLRGDKLFWERLHDLRHQYRPNQRWVYATRECPIKLQRTLIPTRFTKKSFQWSSTYRSVSDFPSPYGYYQKYEEPPEEPLNINWAAQKSGFIAWMSSNNQTTWYRQRFVQALSSHLNIDVYGKGGKPCGRNSTECEEKIRSYKFYLALENSCCEEYISEKFWRTLSWDSVPIVVGTSKADYSRVAPPNSFIYADDFESMDDFVRYLRNVDKIDSLYNSFFKWKREGFVTNSFPDAGKLASDANSEPPDQLYYSCAKVCDMGRKFRQETKGAKRQKFFNPRAGYWAGSCGACAHHTWIKQFQKVVN